MTLTELADQITTKMGDTESASVTTCKTYINNRYRMLWEGGLWTNSLGVVTKAVSAEDETLTLSGDPTIFYYPSSSTVAATAPRLEFVVATRFTETGKVDGVELVGSSWITFFQLDPNIWENTTTRRANPTTFVSLPPDANGYCRIKPIPTPKNAGTLYSLGKLKFTEMGDSDSPQILGADNFLLAAAAADMLEGTMQYQKAQAKFTESAGLKQICYDLDNVQPAKESRIIPMVPNHWQRQDFIN